MTEIEGPVQVKDLIIEKFEKLGYQKKPKIVETINGPKEITEYTKKFLTYSFINPQGSGEYPLVLSIDFTKEDKDYGPIKNARSFIFQALADTLTNSRQKTMDKIYGHDQYFLVVDTNLEGIQYVEKVLEKLKVPDFSFKLDNLENSVQGKLLKELGFQITPGNHNDLLVGDKPHIHVIHAPIKPGTKGKETYVNYEWKIKIDANALLPDKKIIKNYNEIIDKHGLHSYKEGNSFVEARPFPLANSPKTGFIVSRVNIPGLVEISKLFDPPSVEK
jgi:hypothetical protein